MMVNDLKKWVKAAGIRAIRTVCQSLLAGIATYQTFSEVDWRLAIGTALFAGLLSILTSAVTKLPEIKEEYIDGKENVG